MFGSTRHKKFGIIFAFSSVYDMCQFTSYVIFKKDYDMQNDFFDNKAFSYALKSSQILNMLYKLGDSKKSIHSHLIDDAKNFIEIIQKGALLEETRDISLLNYNLLANNNGFFIYSYGLKAIGLLMHNSDAQTYLSKLFHILQNIDSASKKEIADVEDFFEAISNLLNNEVESAKYTANSNSYDVLGVFARA